MLKVKVQTEKSHTNISSNDSKAGAHVSTPNTVSFIAKKSLDAKRDII